jgi:hypothetical protein
MGWLIALGLIVAYSVFKNTGPRTVTSAPIADSGNTVRVAGFSANGINYVAPPNVYYLVQRIAQGVNVGTYQGLGESSLFSAVNPVPTGTKVTFNLSDVLP